MKESPSIWRHFTAPRISLLVAAAIIVWGYRFPTDRYITPERGLGYALGIIGGSMMLVLLLYPARKRLRWLWIIGTIKRWFQTHMVLGVAGPICVLFHCNFRLGAANSNIALWSMIVVASSGLVGRYFYTKIHAGLHGHRTSLGELQQAADRLRSHSNSVVFLPELIERLEAVERQIMRGSPLIDVALVRPFYLALTAFVGRRRLRRYVNHALKHMAQPASVLEAHAARLRSNAYQYIERRIAAARRVAEFEVYDRLFSWWHVLHLPLFFMLLVAGIAHVIAVHVY
jgi:hypothetical protein